MTKTTTPKAPRLTKAQKAEQALAQSTQAIELPALRAENMLERAEIAQHNADIEAKLDALQDEAFEAKLEGPQAPAIDEVMATKTKVKSMKVVKTVKTGVGAQILQHIADGVLSNKEIVAKVLEDNPLRKTTYACVAWYQSQVKAGKIDLPEPKEEVMMTEEELAEQEGSEE